MNPVASPELTVASESIKPQPNLPMAFVWTFVYLLVVLCGQMLGYAVYAAKLFSDRSDANVQEVADAVGMGFAEIIATLFVLLLLKGTYGRKMSSAIGVRLPSRKHLALTLALLPGFLVIPNAVYSAATAWLPEAWVMHQHEMIVKRIEYWPLWFGILIAGIGPGVQEELFCRAFLGRGLVSWHGIPLGVVLTSLFFGALHMDPPHVAATFVMGLILHGVYLASGSIWLPILLHAINNSIAVVATKIDLGMLSQTESQPLWVVGLASISWIVVMGLFAMTARDVGARNQVAKSTPADQQEWEPARPLIIAADDK